MTTARTALARAAAVSLVALAVGPASVAIATAPSVAVTSPPNGGESENATPSFSGSAEAGAGEVTLKLYDGSSPEGAPIGEWGGAVSPTGTWSLGPASPLMNGPYTAQATQTNVALETGTGSATFTVDTPTPTVTLNQPESPSGNTAPSFSGTATGEAAITVQIRAGSTGKGAVVATASAAGTGGAWTSGRASRALSVGPYTAIALQGTLPGNPVGKSAVVKFTIAPPSVSTPEIVTPPPAAPPSAPPSASFRWFPLVPQTGEAVSLVSTSSDATSPITAIAWALTSTSPFQAAGAVLTTSFSAPGAHVVRLRVSNALGLSSVATETIDVVGPTAFLMQPYPVVRIAGSETAHGVKIRLLRVQQLPAGARVTIRCRGRGCPSKFASRVAVSSKQRVDPVEFRAFERSLRFGVTLEILVSRPGEIGKYTSFAIRRGKLPLRIDTCLDAAGVKPLACPAS